MGRDAEWPSGGRAVIWPPGFVSVAREVIPTAIPEIPADSRAGFTALLCGSKTCPTDGTPSQNSLKSGNLSALLGGGLDGSIASVPDA